MADRNSTYIMLEARSSIPDEDDFSKAARSDVFEEASRGGKRQRLLTKAKGFLMYAWVRAQLLLHRKYRPVLLKHVCGLFMLLLLGVVPISLYFKLRGGEYYYSPYSDYLWCDPYGVLGGRDEASASFFRDLLTIDSASGSMAFWQAKLVDTIWDLFVGRGVQLVFWLLSYKVFTNALLRSIERSPAPYQTFVGLTLDSGSISSVIALSKDIARHLSNYNRILFVFIGICSCYILAIPTLLAATTGYIGTQEVWITAPSGELVNYKNITQHPGWIVPNGSQIGLQDGFCIEKDVLSTTDQDDMSVQRRSCYFTDYGTCRINGTFFSYNDGQCHWCNKTYEFEIGAKPYSFVPTISSSDSPSRYTRISLDFVLADSNNHTANLSLTSDSYPYNYPYNYYCYNSTGLDYRYFLRHGQCMPEVQNPRYQWGFSTRLALCLVVLQTIFTTAMYWLWLDAEINSTLVKQGYSLSQLKAAYALTAATQEDLQANPDEILSVPTKVIENQLHKRKAAVQYKLFERGFPLANTSAYDGV